MNIFDIYYQLNILVIEKSLKTSRKVIEKSLKIIAKEKRKYEEKRFDST